jgi:hypothetical protein
MTVATLLASIRAPRRFSESFGRILKGEERILRSVEVARKKGLLPRLIGRPAEFDPFPPLAIFWANDLLALDKRRSLKLSAGLASVSGFRGGEWLAQNYSLRFIRTSKNVKTRLTESSVTTRS